MITNNHHLSYYGPYKLGSSNGYHAKKKFQNSAQYIDLPAVAAEGSFEWELGKTKLRGPLNRRAPLWEPKGVQRLVKGSWLPTAPECTTVNAWQGPLEHMKGPEAPSDKKELPKGPPDSTEEDPELPGPPECMARSL